MPPGEESYDSKLSTYGTDDESQSEISETRSFQRFLGCYLLISKSMEPRSKNRTYVGFTVNPPRRIKQHNGMVKNGGAKRTSRHRPWDMVAVIHGFLSKTQALQFEWAWQNPEKSLALKLHAGRPDALELPPTRSRSAHNCLKILAAMVSVPPWSLSPLTLTICAPREDWELFKFGQITFPKYLRVDFRPVTSLSDDVSAYSFRQTCDKTLPLRISGSSRKCSICEELLVRDGTGGARYDKKTTYCAHCGIVTHLACLASCRDENDYVKPESLLPNMVRCSACQGLMHWSLAVRFAVAMSSDDA